MVQYTTNSEFALLDTEDLVKRGDAINICSECSELQYIQLVATELLQTSTRAQTSLLNTWTGRYSTLARGDNK